MRHAECRLITASILVGTLTVSYMIYSTTTGDQSTSESISFRYKTNKVIKSTNEKNESRHLSSVDRIHSELIPDQPIGVIPPNVSGPVLIVSYQRCGSSFFGNLFDLAPGAFYVYEPLDSLYNAMYGTLEGWNVPSDIRNYPNGSLRIIPEDEVVAVSEFLGNLLQCNFRALPLEFFLHKYWLQFEKYESSLQPFIQCILKKNLYRVHAFCQRIIRKLCPARFGENIQLQTKCHGHLWKTQNETNPPSEFSRYTLCLKRFRPKVDGCINLLTKLCQASTIRATKTVRANLASVERLLEKIPNLRVVHLIRDPRGVVLSRNKYTESVQSQYSEGDLVKESKVFCQSLVSDITKRRQLEVRYPGTTIEVLYDRFVDDPIGETRALYNTLNMNFSDKVKRWITDNSRNSSRIARKWQDAMTFLTVKQITEKCRDVFKLLNLD